MKANFRPFKNKEEEIKASGLIATIDQGEKWIFEGAQGSDDFGGFIERLYFTCGDTFGTYSECIFNGNLRIQVGFNTDMPEELSNELLSLIKNARQKVNTSTSIWYVPKNKRLDEFLFNNLPWKGRGHKTHEFKALREDFETVECALPKRVKIVPFQEKYTIDTCIMLDKSLAHVFEDPNEGIFLKNQHNLSKEWTEKAKTGQCCVMLDNNSVIGAYILKGSEIDFMAIAMNQQGKGLGKQLLLYAVKHIFETFKDVPYLYCIDENTEALRFYKNVGMKVSGHAGCIFLT